MLVLRCRLLVVIGPGGQEVLTSDISGLNYRQVISIYRNRTETIKFFPQPPSLIAS